MKLKVCGMKYRDNILEVAALRPDYLGFIFYEKSSRFFDGSMLELSKEINKTGVFVDASNDFILECIQLHNLQAVQLHGHESPEFCEALISTDVEIIKVFSIKNQFDFSVLKAYEDVCDYYMFDTKGKLPGGNGYTFNWNILDGYPSTKPYFLSGGIGLDQREDLAEFLKSDASKHCYAIDVNSQFEIEPGLKNIKLLNTFKSQL